MNAKKAITWLVVAFVLFYMLTQPSSAGNTVDSILAGVARAGDELAAFVGSIG